MDKNDALLLPSKELSNHREYCHYTVRRQAAERMSKERAKTSSFEDDIKYHPLS
jgi:hypothetical protein